MSIRPESTANSSDALPEPHKGNAAEDFVRSIAYSAIQEPISGLTQIADGLFNTDLLPKVQFIAAPEKAQFGSLDWHAQQVGGAVGMILPFLLVGKGSKALLGGEASAEAGLLSRQSMIGLSVKQAALSGFAYDALLRPSDYHKGDKLSFLESRGLNGITGAASFTALSLSGIGLGKLAESAAVKDTFIAPYLRSNITQGILSGIPAGTVSAELSAWRQGKAVPTLQDWGQAVYGYSLVGGVLGAAHTIKSNPNFPRFENLTNKVQERLSSMKSTANDAMDRAANTLFPENRWGPALAGATLGASYDSVAPLNMTQQSDGSFARPLSAILSAKALASAAPDTVRDQTQSFRDLERVISRGHDHQDFVQNQLRNTLTTLQKQGKVGNEWEVYPTKAGSPADKIGADYILVNTRSGEFHILDATSNEEKISYPEKHNVPTIRRDGLIFYEKPWFDVIGALRTDPTEPENIRSGIEHFQNDLTDRLVHLTHQPSPLKLGEVEFPDIMPMDNAKAQDQVNKFVLSLKNLAAKSDGGDRILLNDFVQKLERGTSTHLDKTIRTVDSPDLRERISKSADKVLLSTAVDRLLKRTSTSETTGDKPKSDVSFHGKTNTINLEDGGVIYNSGDMTEILRESRGHMVQKANVMDKLTKSQWRDLRTAFAGKSDDRIADEVVSRVTSMSNEVSNGGAVGTGRPVFIDEIVKRLKNNPADHLLGRQVAPVEKAPKISDQFRAVASEFANFWQQEGFEKPNSGERLDPDSVELVFDGLMEGKSDPKRYQEMLEKYRAGDPVTTKLIEFALK